MQQIDEQCTDFETEFHVICNWSTFIPWQSFNLNMKRNRKKENNQKIGYSYFLIGEKDANNINLFNKYDECKKSTSEWVQSIYYLRLRWLPVACHTKTFRNGSAHAMFLLSAWHTVEWDIFGLILLFWFEIPKLNGMIGVLCDTNEMDSSHAGAKTDFVA